MRSYIALGSNLGDRYHYIAAAVEYIKRLPDTEFIALSPLYETEPVGFVDQGFFINGVCCIDTTLTPYRLLQHMLMIEQLLGRIRSVKNGPRTIDLDILLYGDIKMETPTLTIPHPRMHEREFVMKPLRDLTLRNGTRVRVSY